MQEGAITQRMLNIWQLQVKVINLYIYSIPGSKGELTKDRASTSSTDIDTLSNPSLCTAPKAFTTVDAITDARNAKLLTSARACQFSFRVPNLIKTS
jgi:hypothetical protein